MDYKKAGVDIVAGYKSVELMKKHVKRTMRPEDYATNEILKEEIKAVLSTLQPREQQVLELRFGLIDGTSYTLEEVGKRFNVTRERIRQIEAKALRKLRHPSRAKKLKDFMSD